MSFSDIEKAVDFHSRILEFQETYRFPLDGEPEHVEFRVGSATIAVSELRNQGVTILREPAMSPAGIRYAYIADPDGTWISLYRTKSN